MCLTMSQDTEIPAIALPESLQPIGLSVDAALLITQVWCRSSAVSQCGWRVLANVRRLISREVLAIAPRVSDYLLATWERLTVEFLDGQQSVLYRFWQEHRNGYVCEISVESPVDFNQI